METKYLNPQEVRKIYSLSLQTLANLRWSGKGPSYNKIGRRVFYKVTDIDRWMESNRIEIKGS